jgi:hypothetical protein
MELGPLHSNSIYLNDWQNISNQYAKSFHEKAGLSQAGFVVSVEWSSMELLRLCRHPSIRTLC